MGLDEKMVLIAELLEVEVTEINTDTELGAMEYWDSMAALSLIVLLEDNFNRTDVTSDKIKSLNTIQDVLSLMEVV